jgi:hypothetical protein
VAQVPGATAAAADAQLGEAANPGTAAAAGTSRWLACTFKAGVLGVAAYDRLSNEVRHAGALHPVQPSAVLTHCFDLQLSVLQTAEEGKGPGAFQMLQYIKLQVDPQVCAELLLVQDN